MAIKMPTDYCRRKFPRLHKTVYRLNWVNHPKQLLSDNDVTFVREV